MTLTMSQSNFYTETTSPSQILRPPPQSRKVTMGYAQNALPHTVAVEPTFVAFL